MTPTSLAVSALATYRATRLVTTDTLLSPARDAILTRYPPHSPLTGSPTPTYLLTCDWCASVWVAGALSAARMISPRPARALERVLALSAAAGLLSDLVSSRS